MSRAGHLPLKYQCNAHGSKRSPGQRITHEIGWTLRMNFPDTTTTNKNIAFLFQALLSKIPPFPFPFPNSSIPLWIVREKSTDSHIKAFTLTSKTPSLTNINGYASNGDIQNNLNSNNQLTSFRLTTSRPPSLITLLTITPSKIANTTNYTSLHKNTSIIVSYFKK